MIRVVFKEACAIVAILLALALLFVTLSIIDSARQGDPFFTEDRQ
jgi:hypothetical protein